VRTAEAVFLQLHALGYGHEASQFESMFPTNSDAAMKWLELCRRFLFGPYHYSLLGVHSIPRSCEALTPIKGTVLRFPSELGRILVEAFELIRYVDARGNVTLDEVLAVHPDFELARNALLALDSALRSNREEQVVKHVEDLKAILEKAKAKERFYLHSIKYVIAAGATIATAPMSPALGVLTGLGIGTVEFVGEKVDRLTIPLARKFVERQFPHLGLILKLDESVRKSFSR